MSPSLSVATSLSPNIRQDIGIQVLSGAEPISHLADQHQVSRKFIYQQEHKAQQATDEDAVQSFNSLSARDSPSRVTPQSSASLRADIIILLPDFCDATLAFLRHRLNHNQFQMLR